MPTVSANELKPGVKILIDGKPHSILDAEFIKPGKGQAFTRISARQLTTGKVLERTYKSSEKAEVADVMDIEANFLYSDGDSAHFMTVDTYEQLEVPLATVGETMMWLAEQAKCGLTLFDGQTIEVTPPNFVELEVAETDPGLRGDTATGGSKPAVLGTGAKVEVPLFIEKGEVIRVDTRKAEYVGRVRD